MPQSIMQTRRRMEARKISIHFKTAILPFLSKSDKMKFRSIYQYHIGLCAKDSQPLHKIAKAKVEHTTLIASTSDFGQNGNWPANSRT
ncbi:hypothetical protein TNCV_1703951 [Trichonephila clavipes]|nr:hypothetical protein TNCV_1703951 [Trichonephila clavipes]